MAVPSPSTLRTPDFISPNSRRRRGIVFSSTDTPTTNLAENDDAAERRQRLLSKATSATLQSPATPRSVSRLDSERSQSAGNSVLTNTQLKDLYSNCIKLSTENKINAKNAFGLPLIDYMQDLIKTVKEGDMTNFQVASCTLDASAKIYAGRVDSIHAQAYKMLGGLGMADQNQDAGENDSGDVGEEQQGSRKPKKITHHKSGNTIEANLKNLNVNQFDLAFEVDPLFHKTSAAFDEGGTGGLLLNHLFVRDDSCELLLDSTSFTMTMGDALSEGQTTHDDNMVDLSELRDVYSRVNFDGLQICSHFTDFEFTNWNRIGEDHTNFIGEAEEMEKSDEAFDVNAPVLGPECDYPGALGGDYSDDDFPDAGGGTDFGRDGCETIPQPGMANPICNASLAFADGEEARLVSSQEGGTELGYAAASVGTLCLELSSEPSDYSYFKSDLISTWAGPQAWKLRARLTKGVVNGSSDGKEQTKKKRAKKQPFVINFDVEVDVENSFSKRRAATTLSKGTLEKHQATKKTLPEDLHFDADNLFRRFIKPKIMVKRQLRSQTELRDDGSAWYNYDNANDCANYCPDLQDDGDDDDDFNGPDGPPDRPGGDFTQSDCPSTQDMTFGDVTNSSQGHSFVNESVADQTMFAGDGLVAQPNKVQKIDIAYAKTAKKMDVKKLKNAMWGLLTDETEGNKENISGNQQQKDSERNIISSPHSFKELYSQLPEKLSKNMGKNLSVSIAFVCILHLANEKCLKMTGDPGMGDFTIIQGS